MTQEQLEKLDGYLGQLALPFGHPVVIALIREARGGNADSADALTRRLYEIAGAVLPGGEDPLLFEQLVFDLYKEIGARSGSGEENAAPLRIRLLELVDRWMGLAEVLREEPLSPAEGPRLFAEMEELLGFVQSLLARLNRPEEESPDSLEELAFLAARSEEAFSSLSARSEAALNPDSPAPASEGQEETALTLRVELEGAGRPVWRLIRVPGWVELDQFHRILQRTMGWWELYGHSFEQAGTLWGPDGEEESGVALSSLLQEEDDLLRYRYDPAEGWCHSVRVVAAEPPQGGEPLLLCLDGEGACPPEDCGGPEGFARLLASLKPDAPADLKEDFAWVGDFDPATFDRERAEKELAELI